MAHQVLCLGEAQVVITGTDHGRVCALHTSLLRVAPGPCRHFTQARGGWNMEAFGPVYPKVVLKQPPDATKRRAHPLRVPRSAQPGPARPSRPPSCPQLQHRTQPQRRTWHTAAFDYNYNVTYCNHTLKPTPASNRRKGKRSTTAQGVLSDVLLSSRGKVPLPKAPSSSVSLQLPTANPHLAFYTLGMDALTNGPFGATRQTGTPAESELSAVISTTAQRKLSHCSTTGSSVRARV